jgi:complex iron-sulfur molybdoenzyme family reductase subunit gamma
MKWSRSTLALIGGLALMGVLAGTMGAPSASSQALIVRALQAPEQPALDPDWAMWAKVPSVQVPVTAQNLTYPMGGGSIAAVKLQAVHYDDVLYIRAAWKDATPDTNAVDMIAFSDAFAVMFPAQSAVNIPSFCMGQANAGVNIWQWRADSQVGGPMVTTEAQRPNGFSDGGPALLEDDPIYQPARALGNPVAMAGENAVQNLIAQAFGTLAPAADQTVAGNATWRWQEWSVVVARPFAGSDPSQASFTPNTNTNMAVALWNGSQGDRGGQKTVSQFVTLSMSNTTFDAGQPRDLAETALALLAGGGAALIVVAAITYFVLRSPAGRHA